MHALGNVLSGLTGRPAAWLAVIGWAAFVFALSTRSELRFMAQDNLDFVVRKLGHMLVFGVGALLLWHAFARSGFRQPLAGAFITAIVYAASDEVHQAFVPGRDPSFVDVGIDSTGAFVALVSLYTLRVRRAPKRA